MILIKILRFTRGKLFVEKLKTEKLTVRTVSFSVFSFSTNSFPLVKRSILIKIIDAFLRLEQPSLRTTNQPLREGVREHFVTCLHSSM